MRPVPGNALQRELLHQRQETLSPGTGTYHYALGVLLEVYDTDKLQSISISNKLKREIELNPGLLFARVKLIDGRELILPFKEPEDQIYLTYGNGVHLEGKRVKIEWTGMNITNGHILLTRTHEETSVSITQSGNIYDIGAII